MTCVAASAAMLPAADVSPATNVVSFVNAIAPILAAKCVTCHGPEKTKGGYQLHTFAALMKPGESTEPAVTPGHPEKSQLFRLIAESDPDDRMPQKDDPLPKAQMAMIERWIKEGARFDGPDPTKTLASLAAAGPQPDPPAVYRRPVPVMALAFSPDGSELAVGGQHEISIWSPRDGTLLRRIKDVAQQTMSLAFSSDGRVLAAAAGTPGKYGEVKLWDSLSGRLLKTLTTASDTMLAVTFSPDGRRLAASGADNAIRVFELATGSQELLIEQHADWVIGIAYSPDGLLLGTASRDKTARLFDAKTGEIEQTYAGHGGPVFSIAFSADGKRAFSGSRDREIHVWDAAEAKKFAEISGFDGDVVKVLVSSNQIFSAATDRLIRRHSIDGKKAALVRTFSGHNDVVYTLAHHVGTHRLASGAFDGEVRVYDANDGTLVTSFMAAPGYAKADSHEAARRKPAAAGKP